MINHKGTVGFVAQTALEYDLEIEIVQSIYDTSANPGEFYKSIRELTMSKKLNIEIYLIFKYQKRDQIISVCDVFLPEKYNAKRQEPSNTVGLIIIPQTTDTEAVQTVVDLNSEFKKLNLQVCIKTNISIPELYGKDLN